MPITYVLDSNYPQSILVRQFENTVRLNDILSSWQFMENEKLIKPHVIGIINNLKNCQLEINMDDFGQLITFLKSHEQFKNLKLAVITENPDATLFPSYAEKFITDLNIRPFSSYEAALTWIEKDI